MLRHMTGLTQNDFIAASVAHGSSRDKPGAVHPARSGLTARCRQRPVEIGREVAHTLKPNRQPYAVVENAKLGPRLGREPLMGRGRGVRDQALGVAEVVADLEDLAVFPK